MKANDSTYPADWISVAEKDWKRALRNLSQDPGLAGFCLQQAAEKYLKAFLISRGWQLRKIHNLDALLDEAVKHEPSFEQFRSACQKITAFYFLERYPLAVDGQITEEDVRESCRRVKGLFEKIERDILKPEGEK